MNASKEQATVAKAALHSVANELDNPLKFMGKDWVSSIKAKLIKADEFLDIAIKKLPSEAAYERAKAKKKKQ